MVRKIRLLALLAIVGLCLSGGTPVWGQSSAGSEPDFTEEQKINFLLNAKVISSKQSDKGITHPWTLTLSDGTITHKASFQSVDQHLTSMTTASGRTELNFIDSYRYNLAAFQLAQMLGMSDMVPPYVERKWNGDTGSISWWVPWKWDGVMRQQQGLKAPDADAWNKQMYKIRVFDELIYDTDPNLTNVLITEDWKIWRVDFTRAFRQFNSLKDDSNLVMCDRQLLQKLKGLNYDEVLQKIKPHLLKGEVKALMARRDKIVQTFDKLVAQKGEGAVLY
jgi:hypothetical protein